MTLRRAISHMPRFMHPEGVPDRVETWDDLLYQVGVEIDIAESGQLNWTPRQFMWARVYENYVKAWAGK